MHDVNFHDRILVADTPSHGAHVFAFDEDRYAKRLDELLDEKRDRVGGAFLILKSAETASDAREFGS